MTSNEVYYDVLPDGTRGDPIDFNDAELMVRLITQRMSPENRASLTFLMVLQGFERDYHGTLEVLGKLNVDVQREIIAAVSVHLRAEASAA